MSKRGRPVMLDHELIKEKLFKYSEKVVSADGNITVALSPIWKTICEELKLMPKQFKAIHTFVSCNRYNIKTQLLVESGIENSDNHETSVDTSINDSEKENSLNNSSINNR